MRLGRHQFRFFFSIFLCLCPLLTEGASHQFLVSCYDQTLAVYITVPEKSNSTAVIFVPAPGYMDHRGGLPTGKGVSPSGAGVFEVWKELLTERGYTIVQFDKPGTGASSGRLLKQEELSLFCIYAALDTLNIGFSGEYFVFTLSGGDQFLRYAFPAMKEKSKGMTPAGLIHLAGLTNWYTTGMGTEVPVLSLLGDTTLLSEKIRLTRREAAYCSDSLSQVHIVPRSGAFLQQLDGEEEGDGFRYSSEVIAAVGDWMETAIKAYRKGKQQRLKAFRTTKNKVTRDGGKNQKEPSFTRGKKAKKPGKRKRAKKSDWKAKYKAGKKSPASVPKKRAGAGGVPSAKTSGITVPKADSTGKVTKEIPPRDTVKAPSGKQQKTKAELWKTRKKMKESGKHKSKPQKKDWKKTYKAKKQGTNSGKLKITGSDSVRQNAEAVKTGQNQDSIGKRTSDEVPQGDSAKVKTLSDAEKKAAYWKSRHEKRGREKKDAPARKKNWKEIYQSRKRSASADSGKEAETDIPNPASSGADENAKQINEKPRAKPHEGNTEEEVEVGP